METRNVLLAVILSTVVLFIWAFFFEAPIVQEEFDKKQTEQNQEKTSPSIAEDEKVTDQKITREDLIKNTL